MVPAGSPASFRNAVPLTRTMGAGPARYGAVLGQLYGWNTAGAVAGVLGIILIGIGLSMVYRTVQMHDGEIEVQSTEGKGTTFRVLLPEA